jgi:glyoxylase-like metal-dependent hydrolase (beta-lactamase superfamily II)
MDADAVDAALVERGLKPHMVFCTHGHFDHAGGAAHFQKKYGAPVFLHANDIKTLKAANFLLMAFKIPARIVLPDVTRVEGDSFSLEVGGVALRYHTAPGHTPGSCVIQYGERFFTGDTVYSHGVGLSRLTGEDPDALRQSILKLWPHFDGSATIHPGHGDSMLAATVRSGNIPLLRFLGLADPNERFSAP